MAAQGSPRLSLEAFTVRRVERDPTLGRAPRVHLTLSKRDYPAEGIDPFSPLRLPENVDVCLRDIDSSLLSQASAVMDIELAGGVHRFPLAGRHHFEVEVARGTMAKASVQVGPPPEKPEEEGLLSLWIRGAGDDVVSREGRCVVRSLDISFEPAVQLPNLIPTLLDIQDLFRDRGWSSIMTNPVATRASKIPAVRDVQRWVDLLRAVAPSVNKIGYVLLRHVHAEPVFRERTGRWELTLSFTGHVQFAGNMPAIPFQDVVLPAVLLPIPYASVDDLLSDQPLASADLKKDRVRLDEAIVGMRDLIASWVGHVSLRGQLPHVLVQAKAVDQTDWRVNVTPPAELSVDGRVTGKRQGDTLIVDADDLVIGFPEPGMHLSVRALVEDLGPEQGAWSSRLRVHTENTVASGSVIPRVEIEVDAAHPFATGTSTLDLSLKDLRIDGGAGGLTIAGPNIDLWPMSRRIGFSSDVSTRHDMVVQEVGMRRQLRVPTGRITGALELGADGLWHLDLGVGASVDMSVIKQVPGIPELSIEAGQLVGQLSGDVDVHATAVADFALTNAYRVDFRESKVGALLDRAQVVIEDRRVEFAPGTKIALRAKEASVTSSGVGAMVLDVMWDMHGQPCLLHAGERTASLLATDLRQGELTVHLSPEGRLSFSGERQGLYGIRYFNTLLNPAADPEHLAELLRSEEALGHVLSALELLSPELADRMSLGRDIVLGLRTLAQRSAIRQLRHFITRPAMARFLSLVLAGDESQAQRIATQVKNVTEARGIDVKEVKSLLREYLDEFDVDYEIGGIVRWLDVLLGPMEPLDVQPAVALEPLISQPAFQEQLEGYPSAGMIYEQLEAAMTQEQIDTLCRLAPRLTIEQIDYCLRRADTSWGSNQRKWLAFVRAVKRRVERIADAYGGVEYAFQDVVIGTFLGEAVADGLDPAQVSDGAWDDRSHWPPACALGPSDVAVLLKAGLALDRQNRQTQINNRMLIDLMRGRPSRFTLDVFAEIGQHNPRALTGILFAFLEQEQDHLSDPVDLPSLLGDKLGLAVPRRRDFMAGGSRARDSYWKALSELADTILARADASYALKSHLQVKRHEVPVAYRSRSRDKTLIQQARKAIERADAVGMECQFKDKASGPVRKAMALYHDAFDACAQLLQHDRMAFQAPWFKAFWIRNEQALKVLSVVRNYQQDVDRVRPWLHYRTGRNRFRGEQDLLRSVLDVLLYEDKDRKKLERDPLVRLLIDPLPGHLDFTVISAMGVITEGESGAELEDAFARLGEQRGVRVIRAPTGTAMSLEENARRIISSIESIEGPYGLMGYSQGCANALAAESLLRGGTPEQQRLLDRLVCRNLLYSAFNGSAHGVYGSEKFERAMVEGERFLKHYQVLFSSEVVASFLRFARAVVDSPVFVRVLGGVHSLTVQRATDFHRELQIVAHAPTSTLRGVTMEQDLPETLELTYYSLRHMSRGAPQDTQVLASDALGRSTRVINATTRLLERCDMTSMCERAHHWSPLKKETEFVTTDRDKKRCVYDSPKDRHVFPWIDVNARFGLIRHRE
ncbi:MAG TPA: hypothetical protein PK710_09985 [Polyangiaceae bacterium]|jgi:hypothetical protein|nr:MAG: hypothetical protein BWY17_04730 [Deltaproteobacteria bacterium ADurb.Bin207]HOT10089.1 hypothetical protein [Polyangiaceae bacterium]